MTEERIFSLIEDDEILEEDKVEDVPKDNEFNLETIEEEREEPKGLDALKEKGIISEDSITGTLIEEQVRGISKIVDKVQGKEVEEDVSLVESLTGAGISAGIKIPKGLINFGTLLYDVFQEEGIPVDQSMTQKFNDAFENSYLGIIEKAAEDQANQTATGRILEALTQIYGATSIAGKTAIPAVTYLTQKARQLATPLVNAIKGNKYVKTTGNKNLLEAGKKAGE